MLEYKLTQLAKKLTDFDFKPTQQKEGDAGYDLRACIAFKSISIFPEEIVVVSTGVHIALDNKYTVGLLLPRSSLGKRGGVLANTVGCIDSNYHGEIQLLILNTNVEECLKIKQGERLAQIVITRCSTRVFHEVIEFTTETNRGIGSFGSSGRF